MMQVKVVSKDVEAGDRINLRYICIISVYSSKYSQIGAIKYTQICTKMMCINTGGSAILDVYFPPFLHKTPYYYGLLTINTNTY